MEAAKKRYTYTTSPAVNNYVKKLAHKSGMSLSTLINILLHHIYNTHSLDLKIVDPNYVKPDSTADIQKMMDNMPKHMDMTQKEHKLY